MAVTRSLRSRLQPVAYLVRKEFRQVFRDRAMLRMVLVVPILQLFIFGYAANTDLRNVRISILDQDATAESRSLADGFLVSSVFVSGPAAGNPEELQDLLAKGKTDATLWIPRGYAQDLLSGAEPSVGLALDAVNASTGGRAAGYAAAILRQEWLSTSATLHPDERYGQTSGSGVVSRFLYNPELESRTYMIPGIVVLIITVISAFLTGMVVVRERETGTLEQLLVSPLTPIQIVAGKTIPFAIIGFVDLALATLAAVLWFRLPMEGSIPLLALAGLAYLVVTLGVGLLASTVSSTQQQAMFTVWFFLTFSILLSGFFYPIDNMPGWIRAITYINPMRYMISMVRGIFLRGSGLLDLAPDLAALGVLGVLLFTAAVLRFGRRLA